MPLRYLRAADIATKYINRIQCFFGIVKRINQKSRKKSEKLIKNRQAAPKSGVCTLPRQWMVMASFHFNGDCITIEMAASEAWYSFSGASIGAKIFCSFSNISSMTTGLPMWSFIPADTVAMAGNAFSECSSLTSMVNAYGDRHHCKTNGLDTTSPFPSSLVFV